MSEDIATISSYAPAQFTMRTDTSFPDLPIWLQLRHSRKHCEGRLWWSHKNGRGWRLGTPSGTRLVFAGDVIVLDNDGLLKIQKENL